MAGVRLAGGPEHGRVLPLVEGEPRTLWLHAADADEDLGLYYELTGQRDAEGRPVYGWVLVPSCGPG